MNSLTPFENWRVTPLILCHLVAMVFIVSWYTNIGSEFWLNIDTAVFYALNGSLADGESWQWFWAITNSRRFDVFSSTVILSIFIVYTFRNKTGTEFVDRAASSAFIILATIITIQISKEFIEYGRLSPSLTLQPTILLSDIVTAFEFKDHSKSSFPGDHATALIMFTTMLWLFAGRQYGLAMAALSIFLILPRMVVGAHWFTDNFVGGVFISLISLSWILYTPLYIKSINAIKPLISKCLNLAMRVINFCSTDQAIAKKTLLHSPRFALKGFCMGSADIIPGVSGGTVALILGIYERLLMAIRSFDRNWLVDVFKFRFSAALSRNDLLFLVPLFLGIITAIIFFTKVIPLPALMLSHPELLYGLFFGLILASIVILMGEVTHYGRTEIITTIAGIAIGLAVVNLVPVETPTSLWFIFLCGFIAISAMLLPGISGSFILLILGKYTYIIAALGEFNIAIITAFCLGALCGVIAFSRVILWLMKRYYQPTLLVIKGILIGSLWVIWPFQERIYTTVREKEKLISSTPLWPEMLTTTVMVSVSLMIIGFISVLILQKYSNQKTTV